MEPHITKEDAEEYRRRWREVNAAEREELRAMPVELKVRQFFSLMCLGRRMGWNAALGAEEEVVRERWLRIRKCCHGE
jgi:hypothetical protein